MTPQEKDLLTRFVEQLVSAPAQRKDPEASALIADAFTRQPEAPYLLTQRTLQLEQLLQASQEQVKKQQAELEKARAGSNGFLGDPNAWGSGATTQKPAGGRAAAPTATGTPAAPARGGSWGSGLFGNIAATAAGVVAGSFLFQGIQGLMNDGASDAGSNSAASAEPGPEQAQAADSQPESFDAADAGMDDAFLADSGDLGDFG